MTFNWQHQNSSNAESAHFVSFVQWALQAYHVVCRTEDRTFLKFWDLLMQLEHCVGRQCNVATNTIVFTAQTPKHILWCNHPTWWKLRQQFYHNFPNLVPQIMSNPTCLRCGGLVWSQLTKNHTFCQFLPSSLPPNFSQSSTNWLETSLQWSNFQIMDLLSYGESTRARC